MNLAKIRAKAQKAIENLYEDTCDIYVYRQAPNDIGYSEQKRRVLYKNIPCRISYSAIPQATDDEVAKISQSIKLFIAPDIEIAAGSYISINRNGDTIDYAYSGQSAKYKTHQEINLELCKDYA